MGSRRVGADVRSRVARWGGVAREGGVVRRARGMSDGKYDACVARARVGVGVVRARESRDGGILFDVLGLEDGAGGGDCGVAFALAFARETDGAYRVPHTTGLLHNSNTMPGTQSIYASLSILALTGLVGTGVAIGSGVSMMAMQMAEEEKKSAVVASAKETTYRPASRGFAASN